MVINTKLISPNSIVIIGGSNDTRKPGGKIVQNITNGGYKGKLTIVNPKEDQVQGITCYTSVEELDPVDLAIIAIPARSCLSVIQALAQEKETRAFIILSSGFSEEGNEGALLESRIVKIMQETGSCLLGPNCIGLLNSHYSGIFTAPVPRINPNGCDFVSSSGATAVFIMESSIPKGLTFSSVFSVGNGAHIGVEEVLEYWDGTYIDGTSPRVKLLYIENIKNPGKMLHHTSSLIRKGCRIAGIKAGVSKEGIRAASSHTGAMASPDMAVDALFKKAGMVRCSGREELTTAAAILMNKVIPGKKMAIITHAGGPAVMLTDVLSNNGLEIPILEGPHAKKLKKYLFPGASVANPIDLLATGTAEQLSITIDYCENKFHTIDGIIIIFGSPGLDKVYDAYEVIHQKIISCKKPVFPILPSIQTAKKEIEMLLSKGHVIFHDEVIFGKALAKVYGIQQSSFEEKKNLKTDFPMTKKVIREHKGEYIPVEKLPIVLNETGIPQAKTVIVKDKRMLLYQSEKIGYPLVMKALGPIHKTEIGGIALNITSEEVLNTEYNRMLSKDGVMEVLLQPMLTGIELYIGAKYESGYGHLITCGLGGIFVEVVQDIAVNLAPICLPEALHMIRSLKGYKILKGVRGQKGIDEKQFAEIIVKVSSLCKAVKEIQELDINPLIANEEGIFAIDTRIFVSR